MCVNKNEPLFKVILVKLASTKINAKKRFAIVVSLKHVSADGHIFYNIYSMLSDASEVSSLIPTRATDYEARIALATEALGRGSRTWHRSVCFILGIVLNLLRILSPLSAPPTNRRQ
jgi:hypothetical protein